MELCGVDQESHLVGHEAGVREQGVGAGLAFRTAESIVSTSITTVAYGFLVHIDVQDGGCGYTEAPKVVIRGGGGSGAEAIAIIKQGVVIGFDIVANGRGYTNAPTVVIASPPHAPWLEIGVSKVKVTQNVVLGRKYVLESSTDLVTWKPVGPFFTADDEVITQEFDVSETGRYFSIREVP